MGAPKWVWQGALVKGLFRRAEQTYMAEHRARRGGCPVVITPGMVHTLRIQVVNRVTMPM